MLAGSNIDKNNDELVNQLKKLNLFNHVKLLGRQKNITKIMNTLDLYVQSSKYGEGFPNVVAEQWLMRYLVLSQMLETQNLL